LFFFLPHEAAKSVVYSEVLLVKRSSQQFSFLGLVTDVEGEGLPSSVECRGFESSLSSRDLECGFLKANSIPTEMLLYWRYMILYTMHSSTFLAPCLRAWVLLFFCTASHQDSLVCQTSRPRRLLAVSAVESVLHSIDEQLILSSCAEAVAVSWSGC
jgi:hypothetical protein